MKIFAGFAALVALVSAVPAAAQTSYSSLYVFGDSLADSGNAFLGTGGTEPPLVDGYFAGRFSNGPNFADYLSFSLTNSIGATPALLGGTNFAVGGATAGFIPGAASPSFLEQVALYGSLNGLPIPGDALVLVNFGGNDVRRTIRIGGAVDFTATITNFATGLNLLYANGARNFLVTGSPDIGLLPRSLEDTGGDLTRLSELTARSQQIGALFAGTSSSFAQLTGAEISYFDLFSFEHAVRANPPAFGLPATLDLTTPCQVLSGGQAQLANCANSLFFDKIHPTTIAHYAVSQAMVAQLNEGTQAVPEPATWIVMILGFGLVGAKVRSARRGALRPTLATLNHHRRPSLPRGSG
jgi:phospholipase/lecithinase/hemolysin